VSNLCSYLKIRKSLAFATDTLMILLLTNVFVTVSLVDPALATFPGDNGRITFYSDRDGSWKIYVMNADGTDTRRLTSRIEIDGEPSWSPDGSKIAFTGWVGKYPQIFVMNADGSERTQLTFERGWHGEPAWSPDGRQLVYTGFNDSVEIYTMYADGSRRTRLTSTLANEDHPTWSPDGRKIAFVSNRDGDNEIYIMNIDGTDIQKLTDNQAEDYYPAWSPDGERLAFVSELVTPTNPEGDAEIFTMNPDGSDVIQLTSNSMDDGDPAWSPDGSGIAFKRLEVSRWPFIGWEILVMNRDGKNERQLTDNMAAIGTHGGYNWGPDWQPIRNVTFSIAFETVPPGKGRIVFDNHTYSDGETALTPQGTYEIKGIPFDSFSFASWEEEDGIAIARDDSQETTCTVLHNGTLRMVMSNVSASTSNKPLRPWVRIDQIVYPEGSGSVTSKPEPTYGILLNPWATFYARDTRVEFRAIPSNSSEWEFVEWELPNGAKVLDNPLYVTAKDDCYVRAIFRKNTVVEAPIQSD
jgi:Tol biopolymer transport system component